MNPCSSGKDLDPLKPKAEVLFSSKDILILENLISNDVIRLFMKQTINAFLESKRIAIVGVSEKSSNMGKSLMDELGKKGYDILPVNPNYDRIGDTHCYAGIRDLPDDIESVILLVPPSISEAVVQEAIGTPVKRIWMHQGVGKGAYSDAARDTCKSNGIDVVYGFCPLMFFGGGMHKFHFWIRKNFGKVPTEFKLAT